MFNPFVSVITQSLPEPQASLLIGMLFGIKPQVDKSLYEALIATGTIHIVALSGQNISILASVFGKVTLLFGRKLSVVLTLLGICGFVLFVGPSATIIRAAIMGSLSLLATFFGRSSYALLSLILAAGTMLLINPAWIQDISFQLSFLATFGIILFPTRNLQKAEHLWQEIWQGIRINLQTTLAAQLFTLPIIAIYFHRISLISPLTNVLIASTITPIMMLGIILSMFGYIFLPLGRLIGFLVWVPLTFLIAVVRFTAQIPFSSLKF